jgi:hypothetical protein
VGGDARLKTTQGAGGGRPVYQRGRSPRERAPLHAYAVEGCRCLLSSLVGRPQGR